jgi:nitric oxide reductase NorD protein
LLQVQHRLTRYVRARTGLNIAVKPIPRLSPDACQPKPSGISVFSDGGFIYLPDEINIFDNKKENNSLYWHLVRLESGQFEFGTFEFDCEKALARCNGRLSSKEMKAHDGIEGGNAGISELDQFFQYFSHKDLAAALFTIYEHGRIRLLLSQLYPGLVKRSMPVFQNEAHRLYRSGRYCNLMLILYARIALGMTLVDRTESGFCYQPLVDRISDLFEKSLMADNRVETSAVLIPLTYDDVFNLIVQQGSEGGLEPGQSILKTPFGRFIKPGSVTDTHQAYAAMAISVREKLRKRGIQVYKSDVRQKLVQNRGVLSAQDIQDIIVKMEPLKESFGEIRGGLCEYLAGVDWFEFQNVFEIDGRCQDEGAGTVAKYPEWDYRLNDYLDDHVRVVDRRVPGCGGTFYSDTLRRYDGLVTKMRRAFEMLKPEGLAILRQWIEGDQFDYRALLDFAMDRKIGRIPSDRLYIKRVKQQRDVAVMILVDMSRSTANKAADSSATVLDIEKEAIVLFSEALGVVGDKFAIAGFSGTGRFGVDYLRIKNFSEEADEEFYRRINAMKPQRSTRIGAAIRHAVSELEAIPAKVRVMMTIGDGFPNDVGYKQGYAIADTRKAVHEAYSKQIHFKAITVNIAGDPKLDDLYGPFNHNVISDIRELPDKLLWIYSAMTKM